MAQSNPVLLRPIEGLEFVVDAMSAPAELSDLADYLFRDCWAAATGTRLTEPLDSLLLKLWRPTIICRRQYPAWCGSAEARGTKVTSADQLEGMDVGKFAILFISGGKFTGNQ